MRRMFGRRRRRENARSPINRATYLATSREQEPSDHLPAGTQDRSPPSKKEGDSAPFDERRRLLFC